MLNVVDIDRSIRVVSPNSASEEQLERLSDLRDQKVVVVLGDPGLGKTTALKREAEATGGAFMSIRQFGLRLDHEIPQDVPLFLDGLDEHRADGSPKDKIDALVLRLKRLAIKQVRLSCRVHDWFGSSDLQAIEEISPSQPPTVAQLLALNEEEIEQILHKLGVSDAAGFRQYARQAGVEGWLDNPQSLRLLYQAVSGGAKWPTNRLELFQQASEVVAREENDLRRTGTSLDVAVTDILDIAGGICAIHLISGQPVATRRARHSREVAPFSAVAKLGPPEVVHAAMQSRIFEVDVNGVASPQHRTSAEFLAARYLSRRIISGSLPRERMIALITSSNGQVPSELRGLYAWLPVLLPADRILDLHRRDPYSVLAYGDARSLPAAIRRDTLLALGDMDDPWFRSKAATEPGLGSLVTIDLENELSTLLSDKGAHVHARTFVCDALAANRGPISLLTDLETIILDAAEVPYLRETALDALLSISDSVGNSALPQTIYTRLQSQLPAAVAARLRIAIVAHLWPDHTTATDALQVIEDWRNRTHEDSVLGYLRPLERQLEKHPREAFFDPGRVQAIRGIKSADHGTEEDHLFSRAAQAFLRIADPLDGKTLHRVLSCVRKNDSFSGPDLPSIVRERLSQRSELGNEWLEAMLLAIAPEDWD
jgi:hypothetical protein